MANAARSSPSPPGPDEPEALRARIVELERELATHRLEIGALARAASMFAEGADVSEVAQRVVE
jgi:hypothetical protein